ncbi:tRNA (cytidine(34)-2'-O)-methyltransferase [Isoptericola sp. b441]|uniref:Putative tRNA (cytidine(34)-2'-O)-methyltransferase n=1 Tax=Actinotalea lenta TaxID=3064654 RepID=A0ABT9D874_9CELL|nr:MULTISPECIES: tRNA (cytidine(34)-2'-O)-methyltransferase [unclassified Isoptericola]MDO8106449.1 tRNA (cytidine(34)-2'-O)-methyltransferase [Isoptericola sp. b441]MDO8121835.1 tRNA (cytidine(34)-2'-O)-methyltransferase [Isoptericola sp. b490]
MLHVVLFEPRIAGNTGNAIRMVAGTGATLHLVEPLGFTLDEPRLRRAGLDYHDLAHVVVHPDVDALLSALPRARVWAFTTRAPRWNTEVDWRDDDALLFGPEPSGLPEDVLAHPRVTGQVRIPMVPGRRSMNLANAAAVATYEAWRRLGFPGAS